MIPGFRMLRRLGMLVAIAGVLFVGANVAVARIAEGKIADAAQKEFGLDEKPVIHIKGMILLGLLRGSLPGITFEARNVKEQGLTIDVVTVDLRGVKASGIFGGKPSVTVLGGDVHATVSQTSLNAYLRDNVGDVRTSIGERGAANVTARKDGHVYVARGALRLSGTMLRFDPATVTIDGKTPPPGFEQAAKQRAAFKVRIPALPGDIQVRTLETHRRSMSLTAAVDARTFSVGA